MKHNVVKDLQHLMVNISGDQSLAVRNGRPCVKSCDSDLSQPVNEYPRCAHDIHNGNVIGGGAGGHCTCDIRKGAFKSFLHVTLTPTPLIFKVQLWSSASSRLSLRSVYNVDVYI